MIGRALEGNVESDFHLELLGPLDQVCEVLQRSQRGMDRRMAALRGADRPRAAFISRGGFNGVVLAFAEAFSDGRDGGQVEDVKAHFRHIVHPFGHVAQGAVLSRGG